MTMKAFVTEGTVELIPCETCQQLVPATYSLGPVEHEGLIVEGVMRAVCNQCGDIIATTPQSAHRFRERIAEIQKGLEEVENNEIATPEEVEAVFARWRAPLEPG